MKEEKSSGAGPNTSPQKSLSELKKKSTKERVENEIMKYLDPLTEPNDWSTVIKGEEIEVKKAHEKLADTQFILTKAEQNKLEDVFPEDF